MKRWRTPTGPPHALQPELTEVFSRLQTSGHHYDEQIYGGKMGEKVNQSSCYAVDRSRTEEVKTTRNWLMWEAFDTTGGHGDILAQAAADGHVFCPWIYHSQGLHGCPCLILSQQRWHWYMSFSLLPKAVFIQKNVLLPMPWQSERCALSPETIVTLGLPVTAKNHVWVHGPTAPGVCIYFCV